MKTIIHTVRIHASPAEVFKALTTEEGVTGWWTKKATLVAGEGGIVSFTFFGDFNPKMKQVELKKDRFIKWQCVEGHKNWQDNTFTFNLRESNGETSVQFVQSYAKELDDDTYGTYNFNWGYYLNSLKLLCENGQGTPFKVPE